jgi:hypothetical protein
MSKITVNTSDYAIRCAREDLVGWAGGLDAKRPRAWQQYGYPDTVTFQHLMTAYSRGGPGHGAVHRILDKCWQERPRIKQPNADKPTAWEEKLSGMLTGIKAWAKLRDFDRRNMVGCYAALIYRVADGRKLSEPLQKALALVDLIPVYEDQIRVTAWHSNMDDAENYGKPAMWQYRARRPGSFGDTQGQPDEWADVHPSRVQVLAEGSVGNDFFDGVPLLLAGFNSLVDLEKISGGSAESFIKNSARTVVLSFDANSSPGQIAAEPGGATPTASAIKTAIEEKMQALNRNIDSSLVLQGGEASTLQTTVSDPKPSFEVASNLFSASVQIPYTILFGQQTGRLASDEDKADMLARCKSRQVNELTPMLEQFVKRMQAAGLVDAGEFEIEWPALDSPGDDAKYANLAKLTGAMQQAFASGLSEPLFDANELRGVAGFEPRSDDGMPHEGDPGAGDSSTDTQQDPIRPRVVVSRAK